MPPFVSLHRAVAHHSTSMQRLSHIRKRQIEREKAAEREREKEKAKAAAAAVQAADAIRDTRTRVKVNKPDYVYEVSTEVSTSECPALSMPNSGCHLLQPTEEGVIYDDGQEIDELDDDEYMDEPEKEEVPESGAVSARDSANDEEELDEEEDEEKPAAGRRKSKAKVPRQSNGAPKVKAPAAEGRRSGRASLKRPLPEEQPTRRSSRRSTVTGPPGGYEEPPDDDIRPAKRSRMSSVGSSQADAPTASAQQTRSAVSKSNGGLKPGEKVLDAVPGKKKSKVSL